MLFKGMKIWIDADACPRPVKEVVYKCSARLNLKVILVANNYLNIPMSPLLEFVQVEQGDDVADFYIAEHCEHNDVVITQDIPLADLIVKLGAVALDPRGDVHTEETIQERLSVRDFMTELRESGVVTSGPSAYSDKDKIKFTNALDRVLMQKLKDENAI
jgi:uncharacterized protein YaiI (UPF0178 family)